MQPKNVHLCLAATCRTTPSLRAKRGNPVLFGLTLDCRVASLLAMTIHI